MSDSRGKRFLYLFCKFIGIVQVPLPSNGPSPTRVFVGLSVVAIFLCCFLKELLCATT